MSYYIRFKEWTETKNGRCCPRSCGDRYGAAISLPPKESPAANVTNVNTMEKAMQIDFNKPLLDLDGEEVKEPKKEGEKEKAILLKSYVVNALLAGDKAGAEEKLTRFGLAQEIHTSKESLELTPEDVVLIKKLVGETYPPLIMGQIFALLK